MLDGVQEGRVDNFAYFISEINGADKEETGTVVVLQLGEGRIATSLLPRSGSLWSRRRVMTSALSWHEHLVVLLLSTVRGRENHRPSTLQLRRDVLMRARRPRLPSFLGLLPSALFAPRAIAVSHLKDRSYRNGSRQLLATSALQVTILSFPILATITSSTAEDSMQRLS